MISTGVVIAMGFPSAHAAEYATLSAGEYEVRIRLELAHAEEMAVSKTARICISEDAASQNAGPQGLIVLSDNNPLSRCPASNIRRDGQSLTFDLICDGHNQAIASATYMLAPQRFDGTIAMKMGGKNMTMTERQSGHRVGTCMAEHQKAEAGSASSKHKDKNR